MMGRVKVGAVMVGFVALIVLALIMVAKGQQEWEQSCRAQGGRVDKTTHINNGYGFNSKGDYGPVTTTDTTYYCLSDDGRILDIR